MAHIRSGDAPVEVGGVRVAAVGVDVRAGVHRGPTARQRGAQITGGPSSLDTALRGAGLVEQTSLEVDVTRTSAPLARGAAASPGVVRVEVPVEDGVGNILLVEEDGVLRWVLPTQPEVVARGATTAQVRTFELPVDGSPAADGPQARGVLGAIGRRVVRVLGFKLLDDALGKVGDFFVRRWEETHHRYRLRSFTPDDYFLPLGTELEPARLADIARAGRALLVIHGTGSLTHSGFGLLPRDAVRGFNDRYGGRVIAFDHPTLSPTPIENARWLAANLPSGAGLDVDILCHSRGGLVARSLAERAETVQLDPGTLRVSSVTFVATPNRGTALCDRAHLSQLVDSFTNLLDFVPDNPVIDAMGALLEMLKQLAVGAYGGLDGAMSMDPAGEFLRDLNRAPGTTARYFAIAADYEPPSGAPAARRFRDHLLDKVFGAPNDLIVPTDSVHGENGSPMFPIADALVLSTDHAVDHSTFWIAEPVLEAFTRWLPPATAATRSDTAPAPRAVAPSEPAAAPTPEAAPDPEPPAAPRPTLDVGVLHASVEASSHPVIVGHYEGAPIAGAEAFIDARLHGKLTRRQVVGLYPGDLGDALVVDGDDLVPGVLVVGLGPRGDLNPASLTNAVSTAVLTYALDLVDRATPTSTGLSTVLIGTNGADGLLIAQSVQAIVEGTIIALRKIAEQRPGDPLPITEIEFIEVYARRAHRAAHAVRDLHRCLSTALLDFVDLRAAEHLGQADGARPGDLPIEYDAGSWRRLVVTRRDDTDVNGIFELDFTSLGGRARADRLRQPVDRSLLQRLITDSMFMARPEESINRALFELLFPADLKHDLATVDKLQLIVDDETADFPWELLADRDAPRESEALAIRTGMLRQLQVTERRHLDRGVAAETSAIVIGNPPAGPAHPFLDGAAREALAVRDALTESGYAVAGHVWDGVSDPKVSPGGLTAALLNSDFRIVHIAAHGSFEVGAEGSTPRGGVVIGDGVYLTASTIAQMRRPPDIVFLNCCHLGQINAAGADHATGRSFTEQNLNRLAASLARELMKSGVRAVVAAGWPVIDHAAKAFAETFYRHLLAGDTYGDAVCAARKTAFDVDPTSNTWAAYQCYGDPAFRLATPTRSAPTRIRPVGPDELIRVLTDLAVDAGDPGVDDAKLIEQVRALEADLVPAWNERADVLAAFGATYGELQALGDSVRAYEAALRAQRGTMPMRAIEQLANISVRHAAAMHRRSGGAPAPDDAQTIDRLFRDAERRLLALLDLGETPERRAQLGAVYKRWAGVSKRRELVVHAIEHYLRSDTANGKLNALQLAAVTDAELTPEVRAQLDVSREWLATFTPNSRHGYWDRVGPADAELTTALIHNALGDQLDTILRRYRDVFRSGRSTPRERDSTTTHLLDLAAIAMESERVALERLCIDLRDAPMSVESPVSV